MITVTLYGRKDCHLCEQAKADLQALQPRLAHKLVEVDIDSDPELVQRYGLEIPVVLVGPFTIRAPFDRTNLEVTLSAAIDRERHIERVENSPELVAMRNSRAWTRADAIDLWLARHYMFLINSVVILYLGLSFLAPVLVKSGYPTLGGWLYRGYGFVCHQLGYRSFFMFGEQPYYPRAAANMPEIKTFEQATGIGEGSSAKEIFAARDFIGNEQVGYKIALCERDVAIYFSILLFGAIFSLTGRRLKAIPWWLWLALAIVPIGLDGFSQLLSQPPLNFLDFRESTPFLRVLTGSMFGFFSAWFGIPTVEEGFIDTRKYKEARLANAKK